ncbi:hypothetical protein GCM10008179_34260 [Hansschlegelia plantiphila]|uniref:Uncharacterized protein n=1 Tax=Hansschlegelia plantiphila TaxID=374655 RepID=A0A9W6J5R1_9HYPH|nr:hypothetical protein GCM10008179_34260 [Hansschlegelia plantiphila]
MCNPEGGELVLEVRCLVTGVLELCTIEGTSLRSGVPLDELVAALNAFGGCETDGYAIVQHETLCGCGWRHRPA